MIESSSDGTGVAGPGILQKSAASTVFNAGAQTFVFGFTGVDSTGNRVGYVGMLPMTPSGTGGTITGGLLDSHDNGNTTNLWRAPPRALIANYSPVPAIPSFWPQTPTSRTTPNFA